MKYSVAIASLGRADKIATKKLFEDKGKITVFVDDEKEKEEYEKFNPELKIVSCGSKGIAKCRNFIFDYYPQEEKILMMCDDVTGIYHKYGEHSWRHWKMSNEEIDEFIQYGFLLCEGYKTKMWGISPTSGGGINLKNKICFAKFIIGTFCGIINNNIKCDERLPLKEDYDLTAKYIKEFGKIVAIDNVHPCARHYTNKGGAVSYRSSDKETIAINILKELHGDWVKDNPKRANEILFRPKMPKGFVKTVPLVNKWVNKFGAVPTGDIEINLE